SEVRIHSNNKSSQLSSELNAQAFTVGNDIYFNEGKYQPESSEGKYLLAHELTHTVQQGKNDLIRRTKSSHYGDFNDNSYKTLNDGAGNDIGVEMYLTFHPNNNVDAELIGMVQSVRTVENGSAIAIGGDATIKSRMIKAKDAVTTTSPTLSTDEGIQIDQAPENRNPLYAVEGAPAGDTKLSQGPTPGPVSALPAASSPGPHGELYSGWGAHGYHYTTGGHLKQKDAELHDLPMNGPTGNNYEQLFETTAVAIKGNQEGTYYGSVEWGWRTDAKGKFSTIPLTLKTNGTPSTSFLKAAGLWNAGSSSLGEKNLKLAVQDVYIIGNPFGVRLNEGISGPLISEYLLVGTRVEILSTHIGPVLPGDEFANKAEIKIVDSVLPNQIGIQGWVNYSDLKHERP
ncbi:MAG TPA: DUF4157 domain-containing protein, partial [Cytophaga sp.]|nr:DUF4157 domain-containing protein [Cytophaga sp.]